MPVSAAELDERLCRFEATFRRLGMKVTHQRVEVFREVAGSDEHPDAESIYQRVHRRVRGISRDTVYRTLATLEAEGLIRRAEVASGPARFDAETEPHHHYVCNVCGAIRDIHSDALDHLPIPPSVQSLGSVESAQVQVRGICSSCAGRRG